MREIGKRKKEWKKLKKRITDLEAQMQGKSDNPELSYTEQAYLYAIANRILSNFDALCSKKITQST